MAAINESGFELIQHYHPTPHPSPHTHTPYALALRARSIILPFIPKVEKGLVSISSQMMTSYLMWMTFWTVRKMTS